MFLTNSYLRPHPPHPPSPHQKKKTKKKKKRVRKRNVVLLFKKVWNQHKTKINSVSPCLWYCSTGTETAAALKDLVCNLSGFKKMDFTAV